MVEFPLTKANRLALAKAFRACPRVDCSIECVLEDQMGRAFTDNLTSPHAFCINTGPFWYFAGDVRRGRSLMHSLPAYNLLQPSAPGWLEAAQEIFGPALIPMARYSFSGEALSLIHLESMLDATAHRETIIPITAAMAQQLVELPDSYFDVGEFDGVDDFLQRSLGFAVEVGDAIMGAAYGSLVYSQGIEVSIYVEEAYRRKGAATALAARLLSECLRRGLRPNWDAANPESCKLALNLGYTLLSSYDAYYHRGDAAVFREVGK
jgi:GNAT superfamily N-acetyltransferase